MGKYVLTLIFCLGISIPLFSVEETNELIDDPERGLTRPQMEILDLNQAMREKTGIACLAPVYGSELVAAIGNYPEFLRLLVQNRAPILSGEQAEEIYWAVCTMFVGIRSGIISVRPQYDNNRYLHASMRDAQELENHLTAFDISCEADEFAELYQRDEYYWYFIENSFYHPRRYINRALYKCKCW